MAWMVLVVGTLLFLAGIAGQTFGLRSKAASSVDHRRTKFMVLRIICGVAGFWLVAVSVAHVAHLSATGRW